MNGKTDFAFSYINKVIFALVVILSGALWLAFIIPASYFFSGALSKDAGELILIFTLLIFLVTGCFAASKISICRGSASLDETQVVICLKYRTYTIPYAQIKHAGYYSFRGNRGFLIKTGAFGRLDIKQPYNPDKELDSFCAALKKRLRQK